MYSKVDICNLALSQLGDKSTVENIDSPTKQTEKILAKWYDISRRAALKTMMPNFAITRDLWALSTETPAFGYKYAYMYRSDCLKILGIGEADNPSTDYSIENGYILTNVLYKDGLPVRYVKDEQAITKFNDSFILLFSLLLARNIAPEITESMTIISNLEKNIPIKTMEIMALEAQENKPIIIKSSKLLTARRGLKVGVSKK